MPDKPRHFTMLRSYAPADAFTLANAACGTAAIFLCLDFLTAPTSTGRIWVAMGVLVLALFFDGIDGIVARKTRTSRIGADLDSLADTISFGVAPAVIGYTLGLRGTWDAIVLIFFVACGISRLARYNVTAAEMSGEAAKVSHYEGTPIPTSLLLVVVLAVALGMGRLGPDIWFGRYEIGPWDFHPLVLMYAASGSAMISATLKIPKP